MPVYEYECEGCRKILEIQQRMADRPLEVCPECGGVVRKLISRSSFQLKGSGWYNDGYSGTSNEKCPSADSSSSGPEAGSAPPCQSGGDCSHCPAAN